MYRAGKVRHSLPIVCHAWFLNYYVFLGFLSDDCDDTIVDLSKLSIGDSVHEVTVLEKFHDTSRIATARDYVLRRCNQTEPILFDECYPDTYVLLISVHYVDKSDNKILICLCRLIRR